MLRPPVRSRSLAGWSFRCLRVATNALPRIFLNYQKETLHKKRLADRPLLPPSKSAKSRRRERESTCKVAEYLHRVAIHADQPKHISASYYVVPIISWKKKRPSGCMTLWPSSARATVSARPPTSISAVRPRTVPSSPRRMRMETWSERMACR